MSGADVSSAMLACWDMQSAVNSIRIIADRAGRAIGDQDLRALDRSCGEELMVARAMQEAIAALAVKVGDGLAALEASGGLDALQLAGSDNVAPGEAPAACDAADQEASEPAARGSER